MATHTIAMLDDMLMATAPDGDDVLMEARFADSLSQINAEDRDDVAERVSFISGLTLYRTVDEAEEAGAEIVYRGSDTGWLEDADGLMEYMAIGRLPA